MTGRRKAVCTICSNNYLHFARTLMDSLGTVHPDWDRYLLLCDENHGIFDPSLEPFNVVELSEIPLPNRRAFCFRYNVVELNTAVKPWFLTWLFERGYDQVVYLDPDICVYEPMDEVESALEAGNFLVLTPHLTGRLDDTAKPSEHDILKAGAYNLGFVALARHPNLSPFLKWWQEKVEFDCVVDFENGLFVDQRWIDLAPGMFGDVALLRHDGYNVAYWNLKHRRVTRRHGKFLVNGSPLVFFHFSGLDPTDPTPVSKHQDRYRLGTLGAAKHLVRTYCAAVIDNGLEACREWPYAFGSFTDGTRILDPMRHYFRRHLEANGPFEGDPFELGHDYFHRPWGRPAPDGSVVTLFMRAVWEGRREVREGFPDVEGVSRRPFIRWFAEDPQSTKQWPACCVALARRSLYGPPAPVASGKGVRNLLCEAPFGPTGKRFLTPFPPRAARGRRRWLRAIVKRVLPRRLRHAIRRAFVPDPAPASRKLRLLRWLAARLPAGIRRRVRTQLTPPPTVDAPPGPGQADPQHPMAPGVHRRIAPPVGYLGFFDPEPCADGRLMAWMGLSAAIRIPRPHPGTLKLSGEHHADCHHLAGGADDTVLWLAVNGKSIGTVTLSEPGTFEKHLPFPETTPTRNVTLTLDAGQSFVPAEIGRGDDRRTLSVRIARVALDDTVVLDFSHTGTPYMPDGLPRHEALGLNIIGYLQSELGVGESARLSALSAEAAHIPHSLVSVTVGCTSRADDNRLAHRFSRDNPHEVNLFHVNADQVPLLFSHLGSEFFEDHYNIGYWAWELPEFPDEWVDRFACVDEVWVPSRFVMHSLSRKSPVPVLTMPHGVGFPVPAGVTRRSLGLPEGKFLFLMMYDMHSRQGRKNPEAAVEAFRRAFPHPRDVTLVIKTMNTKTCPDEWEDLRRRTADAPDILLIDRTLSRQEVYDLEALCDCFVSLHRSEGFGLGLAECMYLGKPVIGTNWSGNLDFMNTVNSCLVECRLVELTRDHGPYRKGQCWAEPDVDHAAWHMKALVEDPGLRKRIGDAGRETIRTEFSQEAVGRLYRRRLDVIANLL